MLADAGVIAATLASALASLMGAPRILQAMARDEVFPVIGPFRVGSGPTENPRRGVVLCAAIAITVIALGNLNAVASVISMFFLISYGLLNVATYVEARGASPSFRPRFRFFDHRMSLVGSLFCFGAMLAIDPFAGVAALAALGGLYQYLRRSERAIRWSDGRRVYYFRRLKETLHEISRHPETEWTWQPNVIVLPEVSDRRDLLARFGTWLSGVRRGTRSATDASFARCSDSGATWQCST